MWVGGGFCAPQTVPVRGEGPSSGRPLGGGKNKVGALFAGTPQSQQGGARQHLEELLPPFTSGVSKICWTCWNWSMCHMYLEIVPGEAHLCGQKLQGGGKGVWR